MDEGEKFSVGEDMTALLPYLSDGFCTSCRNLLETRIRNLSIIGRFNGVSLSNSQHSENSADSCSTHSWDMCITEESLSQSSSSSNIYNENESSVQGSDETPVKLDGQVIFTNSSPASISDPVDNSHSEVSVLVDAHVNVTNSSPVSNRNPVDNSHSEVSSLVDGHVSVTNSSYASSSQQHSVDDLQLELTGDESEEEKRLSQIRLKSDFRHIERVDGTQVNVLKGLELHTDVFNSAEQKKIVDFVYSLQKRGQAGKLRKRTYSEPLKERGKGRVTLQFGCCYNYAFDRKGNPPGIVRGETVDPLPPMFKAMIKRLVRWYVLPPTCVPNSCVVNIFDEGEYIPPHIDHHDFVRPFCTVSFLTECNILFGAHLKTLGDGKFSGPVSIPLPVGSVLFVSGNAADVAKHCVPSVPGKRISITFRKMDDSKLPYKFLLDKDLQGLEPLRKTPLNPWSSRSQQVLNNNEQVKGESGGVVKEMNDNDSGSSSLDLGQDNFPPLGSCLNRVNKRV